MTMFKYGMVSTLRTEPDKIDKETFYKFMQNLHDQFIVEDKVTEYQDNLAKSIIESKVNVRAVMYDFIESICENGFQSKIQLTQTISANANRIADKYHELYKLLEEIK